MNATTGTTVKLIGSAAIADDRFYTVTCLIHDDITGKTFAQVDGGQMIDTEILAAI